MRRLAIAFSIASVALLVTPAFAQDHVQGYREPDKEKSQVELDAEKQAQRNYQRALRSVPDQKQSDPWGIARSDSAQPAAPKTPAKSTAKKPAPKQGTAAN
ncbi:hypothetical protein IC762_20110 [Bradyrhizobium genosp. L]|uniref:hypothetical protein n=1 Tax=Bradyrhizobium genosp. L TaxID=83637 RepID=UPI0018A2E498|nr:hypothetical protein [Bradyrhizobium genosp. L]QPF82086.1 hypothetical protein IC762_20110 [Bradyrhizobium genosp. L]